MYAIVVDGVVYTGFESEELAQDAADDCEEAEVCEVKDKSEL